MHTITFREFIKLSLTVKFIWIKRYYWEYVEHTSYMSSIVEDELAHQHQKDAQEYRKRMLTARNMLQKL